MATILIILFLGLIIFGLITQLPWIAGIVGIAWGITTGGWIGYGFAALILVVLAIWETSRD